MGKDLSDHRQTERDRQLFSEKLRQETGILMEWFSQKRFVDRDLKCGIELEGWIVDKNFCPLPLNEELIEGLNAEEIVTELSRFNFEINCAPHPMKGGFLSTLSKELVQIWSACQIEAEKMEAKVVQVGILPLIEDDRLNLQNISPNSRYKALNEQVLRLRNKKPLKLDIQGQDRLISKHNDVMLEAAATSLQVHIQVSEQAASKAYNASLLTAAPLVAATANSPFLFGKSLWDETRIPLFEQGVDLPSFLDKNGDMVKRVTFGSNWAINSLFELFLENLDGYPVLLAEIENKDPTELFHLLMHNGTIWRWIRPIVGFSQRGQPHLRIENRVAPAGPSIIDSVANVALVLGLTGYFTQEEGSISDQIDFKTARNNFYLAARHGLEGRIKWLDGKQHLIQSLLLENLLPKAQNNLIKQGFDQAEVAYYLGDVMWGRIESGRNGACWQRNFIRNHGPDFQKMSEAYYRGQNSDLPVHLWT